MKTTPKVRDEFYSQIWKLVLPIVIQNLLSAAISSADVIMLNYVDQNSIAAVSLAAQYATILFSVYYGLGTGATMLCAQYHGKGDTRAIEVVQGIALRFSLIISTAFALCALLIPDLMMVIFTDDPALIELGAKYLRILSVSYFCWGITEVYFSVLRSVERVTICTVLNAISFVVNIILNAVFIFGLFGAPRLGVVGVAIATSTARVISLIGCFIVSACSRSVKLKFSALFVRNKVLFRDFVRLTLPALGNDIVWGVAFSLYAAIIGHLGSDAVAANSFVSVVRNLGTILCFAIASAGSILLGKIIGENRLEDARAGAKKLLKLTFISGAIGGVIVLASMPVVLKFASVSLTETAMHYLTVMMLINSYYVMGAAVNTTLIAGVFRSGGDSRFGFICDTIDMWCYAIPLGLLSAFVFKLPVLWVYFLLCTDEFVKWPWVFRHYRSGKWLNNITRESDEINTGSPDTPAVSEPAQ
ncbi:MAG: MATE family efflux transporter [Ruminococcaceae bacterium]|nr:MATE family efflux transporter [Oscillospiraceae bacterium]